MELAAIVVNIGIFIATAGAAAVAWRQAIDAAQSKEQANAAREAALTAWQDSASALTAANSITASTLRAPYAAALSKLASSIMSARVAKLSEEQVLDILTKAANDQHALQFATNEPSARKLARWVNFVAQNADLGTPYDFFTHMKAASLVEERLRRWIADPDTVMSEIREQPGVGNDSPIDPNDLMDYRLP